MNRLRNMQRLELEVWENMEPGDKVEFEGRYGKWGGLPYDIKAQSLARYFALRRERATKAEEAERETQRINQLSGILESVLSHSMDPMTEVLRESLAGIQQVRDKLDHNTEIENSLRTAYEELKAHTERLEAKVEERQSERPIETASAPQVPQLSYTNCIRHHPSNEQYPTRRPGPERCIMTIPQQDGIHMRCLVAYASQNTDDQGFARLPYQVFHAELLRQGGCPRPLSRSISRRIPGISWLFMRPEICPLASGEEKIIGYGNR